MAEELSEWMKEPVTSAEKFKFKAWDIEKMNQWFHLLKKVTGKEEKVRIRFPDVTFSVQGVGRLRQYVFRFPFEVGEAGSSEQNVYEFGIFETLPGKIDWTVHKNWEMLSQKDNGKEMKVCLLLAKDLAKSLPTDSPEARRAAEMWEKAEL